MEDSPLTPTTAAAPAALGENAALGVMPSTPNKAAQVKLFLRSVGSAPALPQQKFKLDGSKTLLEVEKYLMKKLGLQSSDSKSLFLYCGSGFSPTPDQVLQDLFDSFQTGGELIIIYGLQEAWG